MANTAYYGYVKDQFILLPRPRLSEFARLRARVSTLRTLEIFIVIETRALAGEILIDLRHLAKYEFLCALLSYTVRVRFPLVIRCSSH